MTPMETATRTAITAIVTGAVAFTVKKRVHTYRNDATVVGNADVAG